MRRYFFNYIDTVAMISSYFKRDKKVESRITWEWQSQRWRSL